MAFNPVILAANKSCDKKLREAYPSDRPFHHQAPSALFQPNKVANNLKWSRFLRHAWHWAFLPPKKYVWLRLD
jgi:hypothetical protein